MANLLNIVKIPNQPEWLLTANAIAEDPGNFVHDSTPTELCEFVGNLAKKIVELGEEAQKKTSINELLVKHSNLHHAVCILIKGLQNGKAYEAIANWDEFRKAN